MHPTPEEVNTFDITGMPLAAQIDTTVNNSSSAKRVHKHALSASHLSQHNLANGVLPTAELKTIVVRIEVNDTGCAKIFARMIQ